MTTDQESKKLIETEKRLLEYAGDDRVVLSSAYLDLKKTDCDIGQNFYTGITRLDNLTDGFRTGELITVSGYTGQGKTTFCQTITQAFSSCEIRCLWFTFEVLPVEFLKKFSGLEPIALPLELKPRDIHWLGERIWEAKLKYNCRVVFIDHLHFIADVFHMRHPSLEIGSLMRWLKTDVALKHNMAVFLIAHTTKSSRDDFDKPPDERDLRDSSFVAQESDQVLTVYRVIKKGSGDNESKVIVCKNRRTGTFRKAVNLIKVGDFFKELINENSEEN